MPACIKYESCKKDFACDILGECVFGHELIAKYHSDEPQTILHHSQNIGSVVGGVFNKIKRGELFNAEKNRLKKEKKAAMSRDQILFLQSQTIEQFREIYKK